METKFKFNDIVSFKFRNKNVYGIVSSYKGIYLNTEGSCVKNEYKYSIYTNASKKHQVKWEHELTFVRGFDKYSDSVEYYNKNY